MKFRLCKFFFSSQIIDIVDNLPTNNVEPGSMAFVMDGQTLHVYVNSSILWRPVEPPQMRRRRDANQVYHKTEDDDDGQLSDGSLARLWGKLQDFLGTDSKKPVTSEEEQPAVGQDSPQVFTT